MLGGVTLEHWADTNRFAGIENKQTQSALLQHPNTSACSSDSAPAGDAHDGCACASREWHRRRCQSGSCPNGQGETWENTTSKWSAWVRPNPTERDVPYVRVRCLKRAQARSKKYSCDNACAATKKNNPSTGKKYRTAVTTYFWISVDKKCNTMKGTFLDHQVLKLITSTKENAFSPSRCLCHLPEDEWNMKL